MTSRIDRLSIEIAAEDYPTYRGGDNRYDPIGMVGRMVVDPSKDHLGIDIGLGNGGFHADLVETARRKWPGDYRDSPPSGIGTFSANSRAHVAHTRFMLSGTKGSASGSIEVLIAAVDTQQTTLISARSCEAYNSREIEGIVELGGLALCAVLWHYQPHTGSPGLDILTKQPLSVDELRGIHDGSDIQHGQFAQH